MNQDNGFELQRASMVDYQLRARGIGSPLVLEAMGRVPRERFIPERMKDCAYDDGPLPIGAGADHFAALHRGVDDGSPGSGGWRKGSGYRDRFGLRGCRSGLYCKRGVQHRTGSGTGRSRSPNAGRRGF